MEYTRKSPDWKKSAALALLRWGLGLLLISAALGKFYYQGKWSFENARWFVTGYLLEDKLRESFLPRFVIAAFGYCLPYIEGILGALLLTGFFKDCAVFASGLLFIILTLGAFQAKEWSFVLENFFFIYICFVLLINNEWDSWCIPLCCRKRENKQT